MSDEDEEGGLLHQGEVFPWEYELKRERANAVLSGIGAVGLLSIELHRFVTSIRELVGD